MKKIKGRTKKIIVYSVIIVVSIAFTFFVSKPNMYRGIYKELDEKKTTAMGIAVTASSISMALAAAPSDVTTPVAQEIANVASYVLIAVCVLLAEKMLLTTFGVITFGIIIPLACLIRIFCLFWENENLIKLTNKIVFLGVALFLVVPVSVGISNLIETTQQVSMEQSLEELKEIDKSLETDEGEGILSKITNKTKNVIEKVKTKINNLIDTVAVMIVTTCVIPLAVLMFALWLIKAFLGVNISVGKPKRLLFSGSQKAIESSEESESEPHEIIVS